MSRLTKRNATLKASCKENSTYDCLLEDDCITCDCNNKILEKLAHYEDLEEAGRLIELPCKVGDYVYKLTTKCDKHDCPPISCEVCDFDEQFIGIRKFRFGYECIYLLEKELGKTVFLTKAEADRKLAELKGGVTDVKEPR